jgi:alkylation response protein AidB-like acyl-CoA dehydrogenase
MVKMLVTDNVIKATQLALELTGNPGLSRANDLERHYRDALCGRVHTPQSDMVTGGAGRAALGIGS